MDSNFKPAAQTDAFGVRKQLAASQRPIDKARCRQIADSVRPRKGRLART